MIEHTPVYKAQYLFATGTWFNGVIQEINQSTHIFITDTMPEMCFEVSLSSDRVRIEKLLEY
jgi:hypothetical protein